ncbi:MAG: triose-phosphate isomerase [Peptostreptococcaceae bacterium]|nr:triose-phosphate isomerase [Peptostreptococcaceae bacterium]
MRKPLIAGNWKMNMSMNDAKDFIVAIMEAADNTSDDVLICPPSIYLGMLAAKAAGSDLKLGAQTMHQEDNGAFTGEISAGMLLDYGITHCIIGHSERRKYFNETDKSVNLKLKKALEKEIMPIVCVGETLEEKEEGKAESVLQRQIMGAFMDILGKDASIVAVAYEPIWAIGTGRTAAPEDAQKTIEYIRELLKNEYGKTVSEKIRILYGGSVKYSNIKEIMKQKDIDGVLVGGASLNKEHFKKIIEYK